MAAQIIRTIKIDYAGDVRRIPFDVIEGADSAQTLQAIREAIASCFHVEEAFLPNLKYRDDDGDLCTLVACTVDDMLQLTGTGPLRLLVEESSASDSKERSAEWELAEENKLGNELDNDSQELDADMSSATQLVCEEIPTTQQADNVEAAAQTGAPTNSQELKVDVSSATQLPDEETTIVQQADDVDTPAQPAAPTSHEDLSGPPVESVTQQTAEVADCEVNDAPQPQAQDAQQVQTSGEETGVRAAPNPLLQLMSMGFPEDKAREALDACDGDLERATTYLLEGPPPEQFHQVKNMLRQVRQWLLDLKDQVHEAARRRQEEQSGAPGGASEPDQRLQGLQAKVAELRAKLAQLSQQCKDHAEAAASGIKTRMDDKYGKGWEQERLKQVDAQLEDADRFLRESLQALQERASVILASALHTDASSQAPQTATSEQETSPDVNSRQAEAAPATASDDTVRAAAEASESAAEAAIATVDAFLRDDAEASGYPSPSANTSQAASSSTVVAHSSPVREPVIATPLTLCSTGCGRLAARGFPTCCRTCISSGGRSHGPVCTSAHQSAASAPVVATFAPAALCSVGCGKPAAQGYSTCCCTCVNSGGQAHGPKCTVMSVGRRIIGSIIKPASELSQDNSQSRAETSRADTITDEMAPVNEGEAHQGAELQEQAVATHDPADVATLIAMGFADEDVHEALRVSEGNVEMALDHLLAKAA